MLVVHTLYRAVMFLLSIFGPLLTISQDGTSTPLSFFPICIGDMVKAGYLWE